MFAWIVCFSGSSAAQISPGSLSRAHQSLNGTTQCTACHAISAGKATFKCLDCHREIATRLAAGRGLHASYLGKTDSSQGCVKCHSEHNGEDFTLVRWTPTPAAFNHTKTGYPLEGKHVGLDCKRCHTAERVNATEPRSIQVKDANRTYLGLSSQCAIATATSTRDVSGPIASRVTTSRAGEDDFVSVRSLQDEVPTHRRAHRCRLPEVPYSRCRRQATLCRSSLRSLRLPATQIHTRAASRIPVSRAIAPAAGKRFHSANVSARFDIRKHNTRCLESTGRLVARNATQAAILRSQLRSRTCADCHKPSPHGDQFVKRADGGRCESCHNVNGFKPSTFGLKGARDYFYPLVGKHANVGAEGATFRRQRHAFQDQVCPMPRLPS